ncbi:MAG: hypothetical protein KDA96_15260 [Planctomycetaceae bacterium]|nr:hypothetical protein [Planctomycetaceae bacterium]
MELVQAFISQNDQHAAARLYDRYRDVSMRQADDEMSGRLRRRVDPEDVYQSVSLILFAGLRSGRFRIERSGELRALIRELMRRRVLKQAERHVAQCRSLDREDYSGSMNSTAVAGTCSQIETERRDLLSQLLCGVGSTRDRSIVQLALEGLDIAMIASQFDISKARVRQILQAFAERAVRCTVNEC